MQHRVRFEDIQQFDSEVRYLVKFNGSQKVSQCRHAPEQVISTQAPEYSFEGKEGTVLSESPSKSGDRQNLILTDF